MQRARPLPHARRGGHQCRSRRWRSRCRRGLDRLHDGDSMRWTNTGLEAGAGAAKDVLRRLYGCVELRNIPELLVASLQQLLHRSAIELREMVLKLAVQHFDSARGV